MKYFFFQTSLQTRIDGKERNTLRALPNQTFSDGTPIDTTLNVKAPKKANTYTHGSREDYPIGTVFASTTLRLETDKSVPYYTIYKEDEFEKDNVDINFYPVDTNYNGQSSNFNYLKPEHKNDEINLYFANWMNTNNNQTSNKILPYTETISSTGEVKRMSNPITNYEVLNNDKKIINEIQIINEWINRLFKENNTNITKRYNKDNTYRNYYKIALSGETISSICNQSRFDNYCNATQKGYDSFVLINQNPIESYIGYIYEEHSKNQESTYNENNCTINDTTRVLLSAKTILGSGKKRWSIPQKRKDSIENLINDLLKNNQVHELIDENIIKEELSFEEYLNRIDMKINNTEVEETQTEENATESSKTFMEELMSKEENKKPTTEDGFYVEDDIWNLFVRNIHKGINTLLTGPTGCGKTEIVRRYCEQAHINFTLITMGAIQDPVEQLIGKMDLDPETGGTVYDWAEFAEAIQKPGVVLLDEVNRVDHNATNILFNVLDSSRTLKVPNAKSSNVREIKVHPQCVFFATANIGSEYSGTSSIDEAFDNKFFSIEMNYLPLIKETQILVKRTGIDVENATNIAIIAQNIRNCYAKNDISRSVSTRDTLKCAELIVDGFDILKSIEMTFLPKFDKGDGPNDTESERNIVKQIISQRFNNNN